MEEKYNIPSNKIASTFLLRKVAAVFRYLGHIWGSIFLEHVVLPYTYYRVSLFEIEVEGAENLAEFAGESYILVANHNLERDTLLWIFRFKPFNRFNHAIDSFVLQQSAKSIVGSKPYVVAKYGRDAWYANGVMQVLQRYVRQPLTQGQLEGCGYIPIDLKAGAIHRDFMQTVDSVVSLKRGIIMFPEGNVFTEFVDNRDLRQGAAHVARKYSLPVLPVYVAGCDTWQPGNRVIMRYGRPIETRGLSKGQIVDAMREGILELSRVS